MINILSYVASGMSIGGNFLLAKQIKLVFPIWIIANLLWIGIILSTSKNLPQIGMYAVYTFTSIYSWCSWNKKERENDENA